MIRAINKKSYFLTLYSGNIEDEASDEFFVYLSIIPNGSGWDALARLVQCIHAYETDGHNIYFYLDSVAGRRPELSFLLIGDKDKADNLANWLDEWFDNYAQAATAWIERQYERDLIDERSAQGDIEIILSDEHKLLDDTSISQQTTQDDKQNNNPSSQKRKRLKSYNKTLFSTVNIVSNPNAKRHLTTGNGKTLCDKIIPAGAELSSANVEDICQNCLRNARIKKFVCQNCKHPVILTYNGLCSICRKAHGHQL